MSRSCEISACLQIDMVPVLCSQLDPVPVRCLNVCLPGEGLNLFSCDLVFTGYDQIDSCSLEITGASSGENLLIITTNSTGVLYSLYNLDGTVVHDWQASNEFDMTGLADDFYVVQVKDAFGCTDIEVVEYKGVIIFYTDFTEYTIDQKPHDWVPVLFEHSDPTYQWKVDSNYNLVRGEISTDEQDGIYWDIAPVGVADLDVDILSLVEPLNTTSKARTAIMARFAAGYSQTTLGMLSDSATNGYLFEIVTGGTARISKYVNGVFTDLGSVAFSYASTSLYYMRFQLIGDQLKAKIWLSSEAEPVAWLLEVTDATFNSGFYGISTQRRSNIHDFGLEVLKI